MLHPLVSARHGLKSCIRSWILWSVGLQPSIRAQRSKPDKIKHRRRTRTGPGHQSYPCENVVPTSRWCRSRPTFLFYKLNESTLAQVVFTFIRAEPIGPGLVYTASSWGCVLSPQTTRVVDKPNKQHERGKHELTTAPESLENSGSPSDHNTKNRDWALPFCHLFPYFPSSPSLALRSMILGQGLPVRLLPMYRFLSLSLPVILCLPVCERVSSLSSVATAAMKAQSNGQWSCQNEEPL